MDWSDYTDAVCGGSGEQIFVAIFPKSRERWPLAAGGGGGRVVLMTKPGNSLSHYRLQQHMDTLFS